MVSPAPTSEKSVSAYAGCGGTTRRSKTVPLGPASFAAHGTARRARFEPSTGASTTVIQSAPRRTATSRYSPRSQVGAQTSPGLAPRPRQGYLVPQRGDSPPARVATLQKPSFAAGPRHLAE